MRKGLKALAGLLMGMYLVAVSVSPSYAQKKPDLKVIKDCESIRDTYDFDSAGLIAGIPFNPEANNEMNMSKAAPDILIYHCELIDPKSWKSIRSDYLLSIKKANIELRRIVKKYNLGKQSSIICMKNGLVKEIKSLNSKCPTGFKKISK